MEHYHDNEAVILARKLQKVMIPSVLPSLEGLEIDTCFFPSGQSGGDLFDIIRISDEVIALLLFDVAASGIQPILTAAMAKICFVNHIRQGVLPYNVVERVDAELSRHIHEPLHLTAFVGYLDLHDNKLTYCNTGFSTISVYRRLEGTFEPLAGHANAIGMGNEITYEEQYVYLRQGDACIMYTDGMFDLFREYGAEAPGATEAFLHSILAHAPMNTLLPHLRDRYEKTAASFPITDDISFVYAEVLTQSRKNQIKDRLGFSADDKVYIQFLRYLEEMDRTTATILSALDIAGFKDEDIRKMKIILTELLVNGIVHGNHKDPSKKVTVGHLIDKNRAVVSIMDEGAGFKPSDIPNPTLPENLEKPCGRGLFIVRHYVESIQFNEIGNRVTIMKNNLSA